MTISKEAPGFKKILYRRGKINITVASKINTKKNKIENLDCENRINKNAKNFK